MAGFNSPLYFLGIGSAPVTVQGGYKTPLPNWNTGATPTATQGGYVTVLPFWFASANPITPEVVSKNRTYDRYNNQINRDDEEILMIAQAFMSLVN